MATYEKIKLSADPKGSGKLLSGETTIHETGVSSTVLDELWLYASWSPAGTPEPTPIYLSLDNSDFRIMQNIPANSGLVLVVPGLIISGNGSNSCNVTAYDWLTVGNMTVYGYVNRITP